MFQASRRQRISPSGRNDMAGMPRAWPHRGTCQSDRRECKADRRECRADRKGGILHFEPQEACNALLRQSLYIPRGQIRSLRGDVLDPESDHRECRACGALPDSGTPRVLEPKALSPSERCCRNDVAIRRFQYNCLSGAVMESVTKVLPREDFV